MSICIKVWYLERAAGAHLDCLQLLNVLFLFDLRGDVRNARVEFFHVAAARHLNIRVCALHKPLDSSHFARENADDVGVRHDRTQTPHGGRTAAVYLGAMSLNAVREGLFEIVPVW